MATLSIQESDIPSLDGLVAVVTGGSSGIGLGAVHILLERGAHVVNLDLAPPTADIPFSSRLSYIETDISSWSSLVHAFAIVADQHASLDIAIANAGLGGDTRYLENCLKLAPKSTEDWKALAQEEDEMESMWKTAGVNLKGTSNFIMLAARMMKRSNAGGSIVVTTSATAYIPEHSIPLYCATKAALTNLIRTLRTTLIGHNIAISGVAPSATFSNMLPKQMADPIVAEGLPISTPRHVGLAIVYSATARQSVPVERYGQAEALAPGLAQRWNGRVIMTLGDTFTEIEGPLVQCRPLWWGERNEELTKKQQRVTDVRFLFG